MPQPESGLSKSEVEEIVKAALADIPQSQPGLTSAETEQIARGVVAYRYAPVGPSEVRMALAVLFGLVGVAMTVGKIGGRRLPLVAADLLKYRLGARRYAGPVAQLLGSEPAAPAQPVRSGPGPLSLMAKRVGRGLGRLRKGKERRNGRMRWFGKRRGKNGGNQQSRDHRAETLETRRRKPRMGWFPVVALAVLMAAVVAVPQSALADGHEDGSWSSDEIEFQPPEPVPGRRIFVEGLTEPEPEDPPAEQEPWRRWKPRRRRLPNRPRPKVVSTQGCPTTRPSVTSPIPSRASSPRLEERTSCKRTTARRWWTALTR